MSHQIKVDFEGVTTQIQTQCDLAAHALCKIDRTIEKVKKTASKLESKKVIEYEDYLMKSKQTIQKQIDSYLNRLEEYKEYKTQMIDDYSNNEISKKWKELQTTIRAEGENLVNLVSNLTGSKLAVIDEMINEGLLQEIDNEAKRLKSLASGNLLLDKNIIDKINSIDDVSLRELAHQQLVKGETNYSTIINNAKVEYSKLLNKSSFVEEIKEEMQASGVSQEDINNITNRNIDVDSINQMLVNANNAIIDEKIRKETLKKIIKAIKDRGFIVDTKNNLKIDKIKNIVKLVAIKPDGKTAMFEISLNGKFMYRFEGYEGQACNKDITPFIEDLKNVYDINILHEEVQWDNPDKIQTQKYQQMNSNKGKN